MNQPVLVSRRQLLQAGGALSLGLAPLAGQAQALPGKTVRVVTAFPPGSGPDAALRLFGEQLSKIWSQPVIIDNKPGGNGFIAYDAFKSAAPDGHTLIHFDSNHLTTHPHLFRKLPWDPVADLEPVTPLFRNYFFVAVSANSPHKTLDDLINAARKSPGKMNYGSWFNGSPGHLGALRLCALANVEMVHIPFKEMTQLYTAVATQEVDWALGSAASAGALEKGGRLRFIAVAGPRAPSYPQVPSTRDATQVKGFDAAAWTGLFAPRATPSGVKARIQGDVARVAASAETTERFQGFLYEPYVATPGEFAAAIAQETASWKEIIRRSGVQLG